MIYGQQLLESLNQDLAQRYEIQNDRDRRLFDGKMELEDCYLSVQATREVINEIKAKIRILENKGLCIFEILTDLDGNELKSRKVEGQFGQCWSIEDRGYISLFHNRCRAANKVYKKYGYKNHDALQEAFDCSYMRDEKFQENNPNYKELYKVKQDELKAIYTEAEAEYYKEKGYIKKSVLRNAWISKHGNYFQSNMNFWTGIESE